MHATGVDAVILITNRLARQNESDKVWLGNLKKLYLIEVHGQRIDFHSNLHKANLPLSVEIYIYFVDAVSLDSKNSVGMAHMRIQLIPFDCLTKEKSSRSDSIIDTKACALTLKSNS